MPEPLLFLLSHHPHSAMLGLRRSLNSSTSPSTGANQSISRIAAIRPPSHNTPKTTLDNISIPKKPNTSEDADYWVLVEQSMDAVFKDGTNCQRGSYNCSLTVDSGCKARKDVYVFPSGKSVTFSEKHNHGSHPSVTKSFGNGDSNIHALPSLLLHFCIRSFCSFSFGTSFDTISDKENTHPEALPPKTKLVKPSEPSAPSLSPSPAVLKKKRERPSTPAPTSMLFHHKLPRVKVLTPAQEYIEEDIEEFEDGPEYGANSPSFCKQCQQRKKNGDCNLGMCLKCCSTNVNKYCRVKDHNLLKQKHQNERQQQQRHPRPALPTRPVQRPALCVHETSTLPSAQQDVRELHAFLTKLQMRQYFATLLENGFNTLHSLKNLSEPLLDTLGIARLDHRSTLLSEIGHI